MLTYDNVRIIFRIMRQTRTDREYKAAMKSLSVCYGVSCDVIKNIYYRRSYRHMTEDLVPWNVYYLLQSKTWQPMSYDDVVDMLEAINSDSDDPFDRDSSYQIVHGLK